MEHNDNTQPLHLYYIVTAKLPNRRAHGIQIVNSCAQLGKQPDFRLCLCTPLHWNIGSIFNYYSLPVTFTHSYILALGFPFGKVSYYSRVISYFIFINIFLLYRYIIHKMRKERMALHVRAESIVATAWWHSFLPVIFEAHDERCFKRLAKQKLKKLCGIVVTTDKLKQNLITKYKVKAETILVARNAVSYKQLAEATYTAEIHEQYGLPTDKVIVMYCGSLGKEKGVYTLADAADYLPRNMQVVVVGGMGNQLDNFSVYCAKKTNITLLGQVPHDDAIELLARADIVAQPELASDKLSNLFTSPIKLFEYMAAGKAIVAADVPSLREVLTLDTATFFTSGDPRSLADAITSLASADTRLKLGAAAQEAAREFTWEKRGEMIAQHIKSLVRQYEKSDEKTV